MTKWRERVEADQFKFEVLISYDAESLHATQNKQDLCLIFLLLFFALR